MTAMNTNNDQAARLQEWFAQTVAVLTAAGRDGADIADFLAHTASAAAANLGGTEQLLAGRPGSWEADHVRNLVGGTVGWDEQYLHEHRTEPLAVRVHVEDILTDLGIAGLYDDAHDELDRRENAICAAAPPGTAILTGATETALDRIDQQRAALDAQHDAEWTAYGEAFRAHVLRAAAELFPHLRVPVEVIVERDWRADVDSGAEDGPAWRLWETARRTTPLPGSGISPADYPRGAVTGADIAHIERDADRAPLARLKASTRSGADE